MFQYGKVDTLIESSNGTKADRIHERLNTLLESILEFSRRNKFAEGAAFNGGKGLATCRHRETGDWGVPAYSSNNTYSTDFEDNYNTVGLRDKVDKMQ